MKKKEEGKSSKEIVDDIIINLKEYNIKYIVPSDLNELGNLKKPEEVNKIKRVLNLLTFMRVIKFNEKHMVWENLYYKEE